MGVGASCGLPFQSKNLLLQSRIVEVASEDLVPLFDARGLPNRESFSIKKGVRHRDERPGSCVYEGERLIFAYVDQHAVGIRELHLAEAAARQQFLAHFPFNFKADVVQRGTLDP